MYNHTSQRRDCKLRSKDCVKTAEQLTSTALDLCLKGSYFESPNFLLPGDFPEVHVAKLSIR